MLYFRSIAAPLRSLKDISAFSHTICNAELDNRSSHLMGHKLLDFIRKFLYWFYYCISAKTTDKFRTESNVWSQTAQFNKPSVSTNTASAWDKNNFFHSKALKMQLAMTSHSELTSKQPDFFKGQIWWERRCCPSEWACVNVSRYTEQ